MKIIAVSEDQKGVPLIDKDIRTAIRHFDPVSKEMVILLGSMVVRISKEEIINLYNTGLATKIRL